MAIVCIAGVDTGIGKTAVAELLLSQWPGWHVGRVRVADEISKADTATLGGQSYRLIPSATSADEGTETARLLAAGARSVTVLLAEPRGLAPGIQALRAHLPAEASLLVEGNAYLWAAEADVTIMVIGPGPSGKGLARVRPSVREIFAKINIWAWNTRRDPKEEGFFDFPLALGRLGFREGVSNRADYHDINPRQTAYAGNAPFFDSVRQAFERTRRPGNAKPFRPAGG